MGARISWSSIRLLPSNSDHDRDLYDPKMRSMLEIHYEGSLNVSNMPP